MLTKARMKNQVKSSHVRMATNPPLLPLLNTACHAHNEWTLCFTLLVEKQISIYINLEKTIIRFCTVENIDTNQTLVFARNLPFSYLCYDRLKEAHILDTTCHKDIVLASKRPFGVFHHLNSQYYISADNLWSLDV